MKYLGIDFGTKRVGVAISDAEGKIAFPRAVLKNDEHVFERLREMAEKEGVEMVVVGLPKALSGEETAMTKQVREFIAQLRNHRFLVVEEDEIFSTKMVKDNAARELRDAAAAALILQQYIDRI
ncbi:MAG: Holliday junction resolvase RuvX [Patescibacteria group bacterium]